MTKKQTLNERLACCASGGGIVPNRKLVADAQARIAELEEDRDKWRNECLDANESERKLFERQAELEAEVARLRDVVRKRSMEADDADHKAHTAWNDAIAEAAKRSKTAWDSGYDATPHILALKR